MLAMDAESRQKKARETVNPLAGLRLASALAAAWCCEESELRARWQGCNFLRLRMRERAACITAADTSCAIEVFGKSILSDEIIHLPTGGYWQV